MEANRDPLGSALALFQALIAESAGLAEEFAASRLQFFGPLGERAAKSEDERLRATRRHLEWFVLERPCEVLGGAPVEALRAEWMERADPVQRECYDALLGSRAGLFEVLEITPGEGFLLNDLGGGGRLAVPYSGAEIELAPGDLAVGRVFPLPGGSTHLSYAAGFYRDPALLAAVRSDMERSRAEVRGMVHVGQLDLEQMFHSAHGTLRPEDLALQELVTAGLSAAQAQALLTELDPRASREEFGALVSELLDSVAFDTDADLDVVRRTLLALHATTSDEPAPAAAARATESPQRSGPTEGAPDVATALAEFERRRAQGGDLDQLFDELEHDLGLEAVPGEDDPGEAPDFPGVVGAMVEEFLWETGRTDPATAERLAAPLRLFGTYGAPLGVFEDLSGRELLDFAARWCLEEGALDGAPAARELLAALEAFSAWCAAGHGLDLREGYETSLTDLGRSLPRMAALRSHAFREPAGAGERDLYVLRRDESGRASVRDRRGEPVELDLGTALEAGLEDGDLVRVVHLESGGLAIDGCFPPECAQLIPSASD
jgi:hypothetical protein